MKLNFYPKLAWTGICKNKKLYLPYIMTCIGMVVMYYIMSAMCNSRYIQLIRGRMTLESMLNFGSWVIALFAAIFLFYTNSFLIRRRKKEFGLYNILGMGKRNIAVIMLWETLIIAGIALGGGLFIGIVLSKFAELGLANLVLGDISYELYVSFISVAMTLKIFGVIFFLIFLNSLRQLHRSNAIELLHSENTGEKAPKANWFIGIVGIIVLGAAYYMAVTIESPLDAMVWFFVAVLMVIIATYAIFIAGSVLLCKILQKNKKYYYKPNHFVSVSSMTYRMKRNGAGLASICILSTMVLVMIISSGSLYTGAEDILNVRYPNEFKTQLILPSWEALNDDNISSYKNTINECMKESGITAKNTQQYKMVSLTAFLSENTISFDVYQESKNSNGTICYLELIDLNDYNLCTGQNIRLNSDEVLFYVDGYDYTDEYVNIGSSIKLKIKEHIDECIGSEDTVYMVFPTIILVVPDFQGSIASVKQEYVYYDDDPTLNWFYTFDTDASQKGQIELRKEIYDAVRNISNSDNVGYSVESRAYDSDDFYSTFGGLFFMGIILSIVLIFAAVLIIYYKQISEGYEDQSRFEIMQKVGMTKKEIRRSINSQMLTIFTLPLGFAVLHFWFAFPLIKKILYLFCMTNTALLIITSIVCILIFGTFYAIVYKMTSNAYYGIVSGAKQD